MSNDAPVRLPTPRALAVATAVVLAMYALFHALALARKVLLLGFLAVVIATVLSFLIDFLDKHMPRGIAVLLTALLLVGGITGAGVFVVPRVQEQVQKAPDYLGRARERVDHWWRRTADEKGSITKQVQQHAPSAVQHALPIAFGTVELVSTFVLLLVLALFLASERDALRLGLRRLLPREHEEVFDETWNRMGGALRRWTGGIVVSMTIMGTLTAVGLWIAGIDAPILLGVITFFGTFVPYVGALASAIPGLAVALAQSPHHFFYAGVVYVVVHHVEGYIVQPFIMKKAVHLRPALLLFWQALIGAVFGIAGVIVATPLLACVQVGVDYLWVERKLGKSAPSLPRA